MRIIATECSGCKEVVKDQYNGFLCKIRDIKSLEDSIIKFIKMDNKEKKIFSKNSRILAEKKFDEENIINTYIKHIR